MVRRRAAQGPDGQDPQARGGDPRGGEVVDDLALAEAVAREAGALLRERFGSVLAVSAKSTPTDLVSEADVEAEDLIRRLLHEARPDDGIVGEEGDDLAGASGRAWVVDPIDGTINFLFGIPQWCVSVALEEPAGGPGSGPEGANVSALATPGVGVVYDAMRDECWSARAGAGPTCNGVPVQATERTVLAEAMVATGFGYDAEVRRVQGELVAALLPRVRDIRRFGSAALDLAWTAGGRYDAYFERGVKRWDVAAGALLCRCAGLEVRALDPLPPSEDGILVAPAAFADELFDAVGGR